MSFTDEEARNAMHSSLVNEATDKMIEAADAEICKLIHDLHRAHQKLMGGMVVSASGGELIELIKDDLLSEPPKEAGDVVDEASETIEEYGLEEEFIISDVRDRYKEAIKGAFK